MTTNDPRQERILSREDELGSYQRALELRLETLKVWTRLPNERTDWDLERLLDEVRIAAMIIRQFRDEDAELPF